ncbi:MAG: aspartate/glutamate racemase family protein [Proteobacteria bacterium]|nr:aspartate/glutamate racemase family protein [Pseudomonadota bacterium]
MYGRRGRIGLMVPTGNSVMEPEFHRMAPEGVSVHANRVYLKNVTPEALEGMAEHAAASARGLASIRIGVLAFGCTSGSFIGGKGYDEKLVRIMEQATGIPATTTTTAVLRALRLFGVRRIALATPYTDEVTGLEARFLADHGFEVTRAQGGGLVEVADMQECEPEVAYARAREVDDDRAEAVFISCTGFRGIEVIEKLEAELGKPVISSNQATFADCLRVLGLRRVQPGFGSLFERVFAAMQPSEPAAEPQRARR